LSATERLGFERHANAPWLVEKCALIQVKHIFWNLFVSEELVLAVPLPSEADISQRIGPFYDAARTLNAVKMLAGAGD